MELLTNRFYSPRTSVILLIMFARAFANGPLVMACLCLLCLFTWAAPAEEIVFAVRQPKGPHWYENFGHDITDENKAVLRELRPPLQTGPAKEGPHPAGR